MALSGIIVLMGVYQFATTAYRARSRVPDMSRMRNYRRMNSKQFRDRMEQLRKLREKRKQQLKQKGGKK